MSHAKPMAAGDRVHNYMSARNYAGVTPRQWRRIRHKYNRVNGFYYGHWGDGAKGHATPRRNGCRQCKGTGLIDINGCNCGSPADATIGYAHERLCGAEPCPNGCWDRMHPEALT